MGKFENIAVKGSIAVLSAVGGVKLTEFLTETVKAMVAKIKATK